MNKVGGNVAFIDLEYGHVHGTCKRIFMPIEIGVTIYNKNKNVLNFNARKFTHDIDLELWKNITDEYGNKIGVTTSVVNLKKREYNKEFNKSYELNKLQKKKSYKIAHAAFKNFNFYMNDIMKNNHIDKLVFFGDGMEKNAFNRAKIDVDDYIWIDLQNEIKNEFDMRERLSLDKISKAIKFRSTKSHITSLNFKYEIPEKYKHIIKPHKAIGDAARIFLAYKEFNHNLDEFQVLIKNHHIICQENQLLNKSQLKISPTF